MTDQSLKKSLSGKTNRLADFVLEDSDENSDLFSINRCDEKNPVTSLDVLFKQGRHSFEKLAKPELDDDKKHQNDPLCTVPEVPLGTLSRLVLEARNVTFKLQSTTKGGSKNDTEQSSKPTRSNSTIRPSNIPSIRPSNIPSIRPSNIPTIRSSSVPKNTTTTSASALASAPKRTVSRSLTPISRKTPSRSPTPTISKTTSIPTSISKATSTTPSFKKSGDSQRSRSLTPRSKPQITATLTPLSSKTKVRSASVSASSRGSIRPDGSTSVSATPRTPPRLKETVTLAFGKPVGTTNSPKRNTSPDVTRTRPRGQYSPSSSSMIPAFSGVSHATAATPKSVKSSATVADSTRSGRKLSKASIQTAINHLDVSRTGKVSPQPFSSTMLYPPSIRSSSSRLRKRAASEGSSSSNQEEEELKSLTKEENTEKNDSARYEELLNVEDVKDTNWLLNIDDETHHSLIFDNAFDSPPDLFSPL